MIHEYAIAASFLVYSVLEGTVVIFQEKQQLMGYSIIKYTW